MFLIHDCDKIGAGESGKEKREGMMHERRRYYIYTLGGDFNALHPQNTKNTTRPRQREEEAKNGG
jgi:hypothetical protein